MLYIIVCPYYTKKYNRVTLRVLKGRRVLLAGWQTTCVHLVSYLSTGKPLEKSHIHKPADGKAIPVVHSREIRGKK